MKSIYFVKKDKGGNIKGIGQWHPGDGINYINPDTGAPYEQVSKKEWDKVNEEVVKPRQEKEKEKTELEQYLAETRDVALEAFEEKKEMDPAVSQKRKDARARIKQIDFELGLQ
jgi:uncharacterized protein (UPF0297 family)